MSWSIEITLLCLLAIANAADFKDCGSKNGKFTKMVVSNCADTQSRCILTKGTNATIEIDFTPNVDISDLVAVVHGKVYNVNVPFGVPEPDACKFKDSGVTCPMQKDGNYMYTATLPILKVYPSLSVDVKWELKDQDGIDVVCVIIPARIK